MNMYMHFQSYRPHSFGFLSRAFTLHFFFFCPSMLFSVFLVNCFPGFCASISTIMTFIHSDTATVEVFLTRVTLNAKHRRTLRCRNTPAQCWQSAHSAALNTGHYVNPFSGRTCSILITIIHDQINTLHLQLSPSFQFLICALQVCSENSWGIAKGTCCSLCVCLWVCVKIESKR